MNANAGKQLAVEIRDHHGAPALFINGAPHTGLMYYTPGVQGELAQKRHKELVEAGVHLVSAPFPMLDAKDPDRRDFSATDRMMESILQTDPAALVLPRIWIGPPEAWLNRNPDERLVHLDPATGAPAGASGGGAVSFSSQKWREYMGPILREYIRHCEARHGAHILGYHLSAGDCAEWSYTWSGDVISDFSPAQLAAFREWLRRKYAGDAAKLRAAWNQPEADFAAAEIPRARTRERKSWAISDPLKQRALSDYLQFHSEAVAEAAIHFCGSAKAALRELGRRKICGVFYGYYFCDIGYRIGFHNSGHHALAKLLESPEIDIICSPFTYQERSAGAMAHFQPVEGSIRLHGKLLYSEDDTRTHLAKPNAGYGRAANPTESVNILRRNLGRALTSGSTLWWMDLLFEGWFSDREILGGLAALRGAAERHLAGDRRSSAQVAVVVSEESTYHLRFDEALTDALLCRQLSELAVMGAPFDTFLASDLERLFRRPAARQYKLVIFLNCLAVTPEQRRAIQQRVARDGRTLLWVYGAGLLSEQGVSATAMAELTGFKVAISDMSWPLVTTSFLTGERITYGTDQFLGPWLYGADPEAVVHGHLRGWTVKPEANAPGLLEKDFGAWRAFWSAAPAVPAVVLREIARRAGVHLYVTAGHEVFASPGFLSLHAGWDGAHEIRLPKAVTVRDACSGRTAAARKRQFTARMKRGETRMWTI
jgi:hypothetical protein